MRFRATFQTRYSFRNLWLLFIQKPDAAMVAGYKKWQEVGRQVKKGEKSLAILAPLTKKDKETGETEVFGFRSASVFDVSQTEGEPLPEIPHPVLLEDDSTEIQQTLGKLEHFTRMNGFTLSSRRLAAAFGSFSPATRSIIIGNDLPPLQRLKTLVHEVAHGLLHQDTPLTEATRRIGELEAESCAFIVLHSLGLDTSRYSFPYLAHWVETPEEVLPAAERASQAADYPLSRAYYLPRSSGGSMKQQPKHPNLANPTPRYQMRREQKTKRRKRRNTVCLATLRRLT